MPLFRRWLDIINWALRVQKGAVSSRRGVLRALKALQADMQAVPRKMKDDLLMSDVRSLVELIQSASDEEWAETVECLRAYAKQTDDAWFAPVTRFPRSSRPSAPADARRAIIEARLPSGHVAFVWVEPGDVVRHRTEREVLDERWPQEGRIVRVEGGSLFVTLLGRYGQPLNLSGVWKVEDVTLPPNEDVDLFERAGPQDLGAFGLELAPTEGNDGHWTRGHAG